MSTLKDRLFTNWHAARILRLGIAIMIIMMAIQEKNWLMLLPGLFFMYIALADKAYCGTQTHCAPQPRKPGNTDVENIDYEEIK